MTRKWCNAKLRREHRDWACLVLLGHGVLVATFVLSGHWILIVIFTLQSQYCHWLVTACGLPQHFGLSLNMPDFRLCCRAYTCSGLRATWKHILEIHERQRTDPNHAYIPPLPHAGGHYVADEVLEREAAQLLVAQSV